MPLNFAGPWPLRELIEKPQSPIPGEVGNYIVSVPQDIYVPRKHGPSRFIYIGGMKGSHTSSLSKRLGEFVAAAFGFGTYHSGGNRFSEQRHSHGISPWDLEFWWWQHADPKCGEVCLFDEYAEDFQGRLPLLNRQRKQTGCQQVHDPLEMLCPWR